jgi:RNA polymerase sigma-70 factor (ECF subfamily)
MADGSTLWPNTRPTLMLGIQDAQNDKAWMTFRDLYLTIVLNYCRKRGLQEADAQNVTQAVIDRVRRFIHRYDPKKGRFRGWLACIARNEINREYRKSKSGRAEGYLDCDDRESELEALEAAPDLDWDRIFSAHLLESALERVRSMFNAKEWRAFEAVAFRVEQTPEGKVLMRVEKPQFTCVATELGVKVGWVYKVKSKILRRLEQEVLYLADEMALLI